MRKILVAFFTVIFALSVILSGCGKNNTDKTKKAEESEVDDALETVKDISGWDKSTNIPSKMHNLTFSIPEYAGDKDEDGIWNLDQDKNGRKTFFALSTYDGMKYNRSQLNYGVDENSILQFYNSFVSWASEKLNITYYNYYTTVNVGPYKGIRFSLQSDTYDIPVTVVFNGDYEESVVFMLVQPVDTKKSYKQDYQKITTHITYEEPEITANVKNTCDTFIQTYQKYLEAKKGNSIGQDLNNAFETACVNWADLVNKSQLASPADAHYWLVSKQSAIDLSNKYDSGDSPSIISNNDTESTKSQNDGVNPELKAFLDSYESFMDQYITFMKNYQANPTDVTLLNEYQTYLAKYNDFAQKIQAYEASEASMSSADLAYYNEVVTKVYQKLSSVS